MSTVGRVETGKLENLTLSRRLYAFLISGLTIFGLATTGFVAWLFRDLQVGWLLSLLVFFVALAGTTISEKSRKPAISFLGFMMVAIPFGVLFGPLLSQHTKVNIFAALSLTAVLVATLGLYGGLTKKDFESWIPYLFGSLMIILLGLIFIPMVGLFGVPVGGALTFVDWLIIIVFSFLVIYDWNQAMKKPYTVDNSVDAAVGVYLDFMNIFTAALCLSDRKRR